MCSHQGAANTVRRAGEMPCLWEGRPLACLPPWKLLLPKLLLSTDCLNFSATTAHDGHIDELSIDCSKEHF